MTRRDNACVRLGSFALADHRAVLEDLFHSIRPDEPGKDPDARYAHGVELNLYGARRHAGSPSTTQSRARWSSSFTCFL